MLFVTRNKQGEIASLSYIKQSEQQEQVDVISPEIIAFLNSNLDNTHKTLNALQSTDGQMARVTEDFIHLLIKKNIINITELPSPAQKKVISREKLRSHVENELYNFLDEDEGNI